MRNGIFGILGIVASRITNTYDKPSIVCGIEEGILKGSGRSIEGVDLHKTLLEARKEVEFEFGGHNQAVGLSVKKENKEALKEILDKKIDIEDKKDNIIYFDLEMPFWHVNHSMYEAIESLEPFGEGNEAPVFLFKNIKLAKINEYNKIIRFSLVKGNKEVTGLTFDINKYNSFNPKLKVGDTLHILAKLNENTFRGNSSIELEIIDYNRIGDVVR